MKLLQALALMTIAAAFSHAAAIYNVTVNTGSVSGTAGNIYMSFVPINAGADAATATISNFVTNGTLTGAPLTTGTVSGVLPASVTLSNPLTINDYLHGITLGSTISFRVTIDGPAVNSPSSTRVGSVFSFSIDDGAAPLLTNDPQTTGGAIFTISVGPDGAVVPQTMPDANGGPSVATITPDVSNIPEPSTVVVVSSALLLLGAGRRLRGFR